MRSTNPFQTRFKRRPIHFWWQPLTLFLIFLVFVGMLMLTATKRSILIIAMPLPEPTATYVTLAPDYAAQLFKRSLVAWMTGRAGKQDIPDLDLRVLDFDNSLGAPDFLEQRTVFTDDRQPITITTLPATLADIPIPSAAPAKTTPILPKTQEGLFITLSPALAAADFTFPSNELKALKEPSGECRFYVETDAEGNTVHVLLRSKSTPEGLTIERVLMRGHAQGAVNGTVDIRWSYTK